MKAKSKEIQELLEKEPFVDLKLIQKKVLELNFQAEHNEYTIEEAVVALQNIKLFILKAIEEGVFDMYSYQSRVNLWNYLNGLKNQINNLINDNQNAVPPILDETQRIKEYVLITLNINTHLKSLFNFQKKNMELSRIQKKYNSIIVELERAQGIYDKSKKEIDELKDNYNESQELIQEFNKIRDQTKEFEENITQTASKLEDKEKLSESHFSKIEGFFNKIEENEKKLSLSEQRTRELISKNKELGKDVVKLLDMATGGASAKDFGERKKELAKTKACWLIGTTASIIGLIVAAGYILYVGIMTRDVGLSYLSKLTLLIPISVAVWFTASNYIRERKLLEEYAFKSIMSLSLRTYKEVIKEELGKSNKDKLSEFLMKSMEKIYSSPQENLSKHSPKDSEIDISLSDKLIALLKSLVKK